MTKKKDEITIHSSVAEYLTYVATVGDTDESLEISNSSNRGFEAGEP